MLGSAVLVGIVIGVLGSTGYLQITKLQTSLLLLCIVFAGWLCIEKGALRKFASVPRMVFKPDRNFLVFVLKLMLIVWLGLDVYENFDIHSIRSSIIFVVLLNIFTGAAFECSRGIRKLQ